MSTIKIKLPVKMKSDLINSLRLCSLSRIEEFFQDILDSFEVYLGLEDGLSIAMFIGEDIAFDIPLSRLAHKTIDDDDEFDAPYFFRKIANEIETRRNANA
jgi:hypothetical protein